MAYKHKLYPELVPIGRHIKSLREKAGLSPEKVAKMAQLNINRYMAIEAGANFTVKHLEKILNALKVSFS